MISAGYRHLKELGQRGFDAAAAAGIEHLPTRAYVAGVVVRSALDENFAGYSTRRWRPFATSGLSHEAQDASQVDKLAASTTEIGDLILVHTGIFAKSMEMRLGNIISHYERLGARNYHLAAVSATTPEWATLYSELSERFAAVTKQLRGQFPDFYPCSSPIGARNGEVAEGEPYPSWMIAIDSSPLDIGESVLD